MTGPERFKEVSPLSGKDCLIVIERLKSTFDYPIHVHAEYELNFIENAEGAQRIVGDSVETIGREELVLIANPCLEHAWVNHTCTSRQIHELTVQFHNMCLPQELLDTHPFHSIRHLLEKARKGLAFGPKAIARVLPLLRIINCQPDRFYSLLKFWTVLYELSLSDDVRELASRSFVRQAGVGEEDPRIDKIVDFCHTHYAEPIRLCEIASLVNMSEASFCRFIRQRTSKSFVDFLTDIRLGFAVRELVDSDRSIAAIGYACGFNNLSNFNRIFKRKKGITPSEFRENYRKRKYIG